MKVPITDLRRGYQPRDKESLGTLLRDMRARGKILDPILVYKEKGKYVIIDGHQRWQAAFKLGWKEVPIRIDEKPEDPASESLARNNVRRGNKNVSALTLSLMWEEIGTIDADDNAFLETSKKYAFTCLAIKNMMRDWSEVIRAGKRKQAIEEQWTRKQVGSFARKHAKKQREIGVTVVELRVIKNPSNRLQANSMAIGIPRDRYLNLLAGKQTFLQVIPVRAQ